MKIEILEKKDNTLKFVLEGATPAFANTLRREMISETPVLAIEDVDIFDNNSAIYDEILAQRLGLIPITTDPKSYNMPDDCTCKAKGCSKCTVTFALSKKGPCTVYSGDLKSSDKDAVPADDKIPIVKLAAHQKVKLEAMAVLGRGKEHAKWQPGVISYEYFSDGKGKDAKHSGERLSPDGSRYRDDKFIFYIESNGSLKPEQIVAEAAKALAEKAKEFEKEL